MSIFETLGLAWVILGTGMWTAAVFILAGIGAKYLNRCYQRGSEAIEHDLHDGAIIDQILIKQRPERN